MKVRKRAEEILFDVSLPLYLIFETVYVLLLSELNLLKQNKTNKKKNCRKRRKSAPSAQRPFTGEVPAAQRGDRTCARSHSSSAAHPTLHGRARWFATAALQPLGQALGLCPGPGAGRRDTRACAWRSPLDGRAGRGPGDSTVQRCPPGPPPPRSQLRAASAKALRRGGVSGDSQ